MNESETTTWEAGAKVLALQCLAEGFALANFSVSYSAGGVRIHVSLDKLSDRYGSPTVEECGEFSRRFADLLEARPPAGLPDDYSIEVSSPGAERRLANVSEYERFKALPMKVMYRDEKQKKVSRVFNYLGSEQGVTRWQLAQAKFNLRQGTIKPARPGKLAKKEHNLPVVEISEADILHVNLYVDI